MHNKPAMTTLIAHRYSFLNISSPNALYRMIGNIVNIAPAGAGTPVKNLPESGVFMFSISCVLNLANRRHMQTAKNADIIQPNLFRADRLYKYMTTAGPIPKTAKSDKESSSAPNLLHALSNRANLPSVASKNAAKITDIITYSQLETKANFI